MKESAIKKNNPLVPTGLPTQSKQIDLNKTISACMDASFGQGIHALTSQEFEQMLADNSFPLEKQVDIEYQI